MIGLGNYTGSAPPAYPLAQPVGDVAAVAESVAKQAIGAVAVVGVFFVGWKIFGHFYPKERDEMLTDLAHARRMFRAKAVATNRRARRSAGRRRIG